MCKTKEAQIADGHMAKDKDVDIFRKEFQEFIDYCNHSRFTDADVQKMYENAMATLNQQQETKPSLKNKIKRRPFVYLMFLLVAMAIITTILIWNWEVILNHASALGRIAMIQALPYYDWRPLKHERCFVKKSSNDNFDTNADDNVIKEFNCYYCDGINNIPYVTMTTTNLADVRDSVKRHYDIDAPLVITNMTYDNDLMSNVNGDGEYLQFEVCDVISNVKMPKYATTEDILKAVDVAPFYFVQWRNCQFDAVKLFRRHFSRPPFLDIADVSPIQYSTVVMSSHGYRAQNSKFITLRERLGIFVQLNGGHLVTLKAVNCDLCQDVTVELGNGEALIFTDMWDIEYLPVTMTMTEEEEKINLAVVLEAH